MLPPAPRGYVDIRHHPFRPVPRSYRPQVDDVFYYKDHTGHIKFIMTVMALGPIGLAVHTKYKDFETGVDRTLWWTLDTARLYFIPHTQLIVRGHPKMSWPQQPYASGAYDRPLWSVP